MQNKKPIFIVGCPRSGTTVLAATLNAHSQIAVSTETHFFNNILKMDCIKELDDNAVREILKQERVHDLVKVANIDIESFIEDFCEKKTSDHEQNKKLLFDLLMEYFLKSQNKKIWCEKTPQHLLYVKKILEYYPGAKIIHVIRDGRDTVNSLLKMPWRPPGLVNNARFWLIYTLEGIKAEINIPKDSFFTVKFEDFVRRPQETLVFICDFIGIEFEESMLSPSANSSINTVFASWENDWKLKASEDLDASRIGAWRKEMNEDEKMILNYLLTQRLRELNYIVEEKNISFKQRIIVLRQIFKLFVNKIFRAV